MTPEMIKAVTDSLPPKWMAYVTLATVGVHALVYVGTWIAQHGGLVGIYKAVVFGVQQPKP